MTSTHALDPHNASLLSPEVDDLLLRIRGLVLVQDVLAERGASPAEIRAHSDEAERLRGQLAELILG
jgi:hypothetical protein